jgi:hypothetical protein
VAIGAPNVSVMMWTARRELRTGELPPRRVVIRFHFTDASSGFDCCWLVAQPGAEPDICTSDPGTDVDLYVEVTVASMAAIMLGRTTITRETGEGRLFLSGDARLMRTIAAWFPREDGHDAEGTLQWTAAG